MGSAREDLSELMPDYGTYTEEQVRGFHRKATRSRLDELLGLYPEFVEEVLKYLEDLPEDWRGNPEAPRRWRV